jgi:hypothetical protein
MPIARALIDLKRSPAGTIAGEAPTSGKLSRSLTGGGGSNPTYFIADISANHDGDLERAKDLIHLAAQAGADAAKFQNFRAPKIVSDHGFRTLGGQLSHQATGEVGL